MKRLKEYFAPHNRIARKLRWLQRYAGKHYFTVATGKFAEMANDFEQFAREESYYTVSKTDNDTGGSV
jgi:hypothetical protein